MNPFTTAVTVCKRLHEAGHTAYFAGGWVRDFVMGHPSSDIDIATSASAAEVQALFPHTIPVGIAFESLVVVEGGEHFEVSSFRQDVAYTNGRSPDSVRPATAEEDAQRRDFTINGMFFDPLADQLYDFVGGRDDLEKGIIRAIGDAAERFREDRLRMIRAVRFSARFGFPLDSATEAAIRDQSDTLFPAVAVERVWAELQKMHAFPHFDNALLMLHRLGLLDQIFPSLAHIPSSDIELQLAACKNLPEQASPLLFLLQLFPSASLEETKEMCLSLKMSKQEVRQALLYRQAQALCTDPNPIEPADWARYLAQDDSILCVKCALASLPDRERETTWARIRQTYTDLESSIRRIQRRQPVVQSHDLIACGVPKGPRLGTLLREAERIAINHDLDDPQSVLMLLRESAAWEASDA